MNGLIIEGTPIAVDFWKVRQCPQVKLFFLSHVHDDHIKGLTPSWRLPLYTSPVSAKLLAHIVKVPAHLVKTLEVGTGHLIPLGETGEESMTVTLIDARHCPGAVMFLFEGYFGSFLYTGDFRYDSAMAEDPIFATFPPIDRLYLDNTYCSSGCDHPSREVVTSKILETIQAQPPNTRVLFGLTRVGKEDLMVSIAKALKEWIQVDPETYEKMKILEMSDVFTVDSSRIRIMPFHVLSKSNQCKDLGEDPFIIILPSSLMGSGYRPPYGPKKNVYALPYSNHCSFPELTAFVTRIKPRKIVPIVSCDDFDTFDNLLDPTPCKSFKTPPCVENWHVVQGGRKPKRKRAGTPKTTKGVAFLDEDSSGSKSKDSNKVAVSDSDCDSDSGIFEVLKKMKPQLEGVNVDSNEEKNNSSILTLVEDMTTAIITSETGTLSKDNVDHGMAKIDEVDLEQLMNPPSKDNIVKAVAHPSPTSGSKSPDCQIIEIPDEKSPKKVVEVTLDSSSDELFSTCKSNDVSLVTLTESSDMIGSSAEAPQEERKANLTNVDTDATMVSQSDDVSASQDGSSEMARKPSSGQTSAADDASKDNEVDSNLSYHTAPTGITTSAISSVEVSSQEETASSQTNTDGLSVPLFSQDTAQSGKTTDKVTLPGSDFSHDESQSNVIIGTESSGLVTPEPSAETMIESNRCTDGDSSDVEVDTDGCMKLVVPAGGHGVTPGWRHETCLCRSKWRLEEALQETLAYVRGEPFKPFIYPENHICLL